MLLNSLHFLAFLPVVLALYFATPNPGYSDIAIGTARIRGYDLMENFRRPYFARSIREFWQRWHITLSSWFRDYVYIPLEFPTPSISNAK